MRPLTADDVDVMHALWTDPGIRKYLWDDLIIDRERAAEVVAASCAAFSEQGYGLWAIHLKESGEPIGFCGLRRSENGAPDLLYGLWPRWWGRGLVAEAAQAVLTYTFDVLGHTTVEGATDALNQASIRVMERLGMRFTRRGTLNGLDTVFYELTRAAFEAQRRGG
jgi:RimJ/RimL family protein N-acetyltransferase